MKGFVLLAMLLATLSSPPALSAADDCSLTVRVFQEDGSPPPSDLTVSVWHNHKATGTQILDGRSTSARFAEIPCGAVSVLANVEDTRVRVWGKVELQPAQAQSLTLTIPSVGELFVAVVDPEGNTVPTGTLSIDEMDAEGESPWSYFESGKESPIRFLVPRGRVSVQFSPKRKILKASADGAEVQYPVVVDLGRRPVHVAIHVGAHDLLRGWLLDEQGKGGPVSSFRAWEFDESGGFRTGSASPGPDGSFVVGVGNWPVFLEPLNNKLDIVPYSTYVKKTDPEPVFLAREWQPAVRTLRGRVMEQGTDRPVASTKILLMANCREIQDPADPRKSFFWKRARTDGDGRFTIDCPVGCAFWVSPDHNEEMGGFVRLPAGSCNEEVTIPAFRLGTLSLRVTDESGRPVSGVRVAGTATDANGEARKTGLTLHEHAITAPGWLSVGEQDKLVLRWRDGREGVPVANFESPGQEIHFDLVAVEGGRACLETRNSEGATVPAHSISVGLRQGDDPVVYLARRPVGDRPNRICSPHMPTGNYFIRVQTGRSEEYPVRTWWPSTTDPTQAKPVRVEAGKIVDLGTVTVTERRRRSDGDE